MYKARPRVKMIKDTTIDGMANSVEQPVEWPSNNSLYDSTMKVRGFKQDKAYIFFGISEIG